MVIFLLCAILIGVGVAFYYYSMLQNSMNVKVISIFQTGVYSDYEQALLKSDSEDKIFYDGSLYHVYDAIVSSEEAKNKMISFYQANNIEYFVKEKYVDNATYNDINKYAELIKMSDEDTLKIINKQIVEKYGDEVL